MSIPSRLFMLPFVACVVSNLAFADNYVTCTAKNIPCFRVEPLITKNNGLGDSDVIVYTSSEGGWTSESGGSVSKKNGPQKLERSIQRLEDEPASTVQKIYLGEGEEVNPRDYPILGFGSAFTDSATMLIAKLPDAMEDDFVREHFSLYDGIGYTLGRVPMGSSDFSCRRNGSPSVTKCSNKASDYYTYADEKTDDLSNFSLAPEDEQFKIPLIRKALLAAKNTCNELKLYSSPWSAPAWMKEKHKDYKHPEREVSLVHGKLKDDAHTQKLWADYFLKFFDAYQRSGVDFWATTIQNEPGREGFLGAQEMQWWQTMYFTPHEEAAFLKVLGPALESNEQFRDVKIIVHDDQSSDIYERVHSILEDKEAEKYVDGAGFHWYMNNEKNIEHVSQTADALHRVNSQGKARFVLSTEACMGYMPFGTKWKYTGWLAGEHQGGPLLGSWPRGEFYAKDIMENVLHSSSGWTDWNLALDMKGGPNWAGNVVDAPVLVNVKKKEYYLQPMFFYMGHFSKFVRPGARRIAINSLGFLPILGTKGIAPMEAVAFQVPSYDIVHKEKRIAVPPTTVVVVMNRDHGSGRDYSVQTPKGKYINMKIGSKTIQTLIFKTEA